MNKDADKTKDQLLAELAELREKNKEREDKLKAANQHLDAANQQLQASVLTLKNQTHKLGERVKELNCLHRISETVRTRETLEEILQGVTEVIPPGWQYPEITCCKITLGDKEYQTDNYKNSKWKLSSEIVINENIAGKIEVCYLEKKPDMDIGPFLSEERVLLDTITERLGRITERKQVEEEILTLNRELEERVRERTTNLETANQQLRATNQQLRAIEQQLRAANQELTISESKFRSYINSAPDGIFVKNEKGKFIEVNWAACEITGYSVEELLNLTFMDLVRDEYAEKVKNHFQTVVKEGFASDELGFITKQGETRFFCVDTVKLSENRFLGFAKDITESMQTQEKLRESNERFNRLVSDLNDVVWTASLDGSKILDINNSFENVYGYTVEEFKNNPKLWLEAVHPDDREIAERSSKELFEIGKAEADYRIVRPDGKVVWILDRKSLIRDENGNPVQMGGVAKDITERKLAEKVIKQSEARLKEAQQIAHLGYWELDLKTNHLGWSDETYRIFEIDKDKFGTSFEAFLNEIHPDDRESVNKAYTESVKNKTPYHIVHRLLMNDGRIKYVEEQCETEYNSSGKPIRSIGTVLDITERKEAEEQLLRRDTLLEAVSFAAEIFLKSAGWREDVQKVLAKLGVSVDASRVYIFENHLGNDNELLTSQRFEWVADGITPQIDEPALQGFHYLAGGMGRWVDFMSQGKEIVGIVREFPESEKEVLSAQDIQSILAIPVMIDRNWWGFIGFDDCVRERNWSDTEIELLNTVTNMLSDAIRNQQAEEELIKLSAAVQQSPSVVKITDKNGNIEYVNPTFTEITGYSSEEVIGQNTRILKSGEHPVAMYKELWDTISSGKTWRGEFHNKKKNGELFWVLSSISPIFNNEGKIINYMDEAVDITIHKRNEQVQNILHNISNAVITSRSSEDFLDVVKDELGKLFDTTNFFAALYDEETDRISLPLHHDERDRWESFPAGKTLTKYVIKTGKHLLARKAKIEELIKSGEVEQVGHPAEAWLGVPLKIKNKITGIFAVQSYDNENAFDETDVKMLKIISHQISLSLERVKAEEDLKIALEKAEESDRLKSSFLANMSHEIRTPMNSILGFIGFLKEPQLTGDEKKEFIQVIENSGKRMLNTINDIIDISKIEAGQVEVANSEVSVNSLLDDQFNIFQREAKSKGLELNYKPSLTDSKSRIITDPYKLEVILTNLLNNAVKYTKTGKITMGCRIIDKADGKFIEFYVKDTGIGILADRVEAIFNRFEQADIGLARTYEGTGLGLAISKSYVELLGGEIGVKTKDGEGSTFTFSIPYIKKSSKDNSSKKNSEEEPGVSLKNLSVIVAEDDGASILFYKKILKNKFNKITYTATGKEVIEKFRENPDTDIILMDIKMPDMNGYDATREIRKLNRDVIIIAQTAFGLTGDKEKTLEAGCDDYIAKPIQEELLFKKIRDCLDKKRM